MVIGPKIKSLRLKNGLTLEELASRTELTKGFLSQLERDLTTTSIQTLLDILEALGTSPKEFFDDGGNDQVVFKKTDCFVKESDSYTIEWLVSNAQKNEMEPILLTINPFSKSDVIIPHTGEEFGYVIEGNLVLVCDDKQYPLEENSSFYLYGNEQHYIKNDTKQKGVILWISTPPVF